MGEVGILFEPTSPNLSYFGDVFALLWCFYIRNGFLDVSLR